MAKVTRGFRIDPEQLEEAKKRKINLNKVVQDAIADALEQNICPTCGQKVRKRK